MDEKVSLTELYDKFVDSQYVIDNSKLNEENGRVMYAFKMHIKTKALGEIAFGSVYFPPQSVAFPFMFLTEEQIKTIINTGIQLSIRKRKSNVSNKKIYISFPNRVVVERIEAMNV